MGSITYVVKLFRRELAAIVKEAEKVIINRCAVLVHMKGFQIFGKAGEGNIHSLGEAYDGSETAICFSAFDSSNRIFVTFD